MTSLNIIKKYSKKEQTFEMFVNDNTFDKTNVLWDIIRNKTIGKFVYNYFERVMNIIHLNEQKITQHVENNKGSLYEYNDYCQNLKTKTLDYIYTLNLYIKSKIDETNVDTVIINLKKEKEELIVRIRQLEIQLEKTQDNEKTIKFQTEHISKLIIELNEVSSKLVMESVINDNKEEIIYWRSKYEELSRQIDNLKMEKAVLENNISKKSSDQIVEIEEYKNNLKKMNSLLNENNILMEKSKKNCHGL